MSRTVRIGWWVNQVEAAERSIGDAGRARRRPLLFAGQDDELKPRRARAAQVPSPQSTYRIIRGETIIGGLDEERARSLPMGPAGRGGGRVPGRVGAAPDRIAGGVG